MARLVIWTIFILSLIFAASYLFYTPLLQIYWGATGRMTSIIARAKSRGATLDLNEGRQLFNIIDYGNHYSRSLPSPPFPQFISA